MTTVRSVTNGNYTHTLAITTTSQNISANTSTISYTYKITLNTSGGAFASSPINFKATVNGTSDTEGHTFDFNSQSTYTMVSGTRTITHNTDGTKSISASFDGPLSFVSAGMPETTGSGTYTLPTIPRASTPTYSPNPVDAGTPVTITTNRASSSFTHTMTYTFGSLTGTIVTGLTTFTTSWTPPLSLIAEIPTATSGVVKIKTTTYDSGGDSIGSTTTNLTINVPANVKPTITSATVSEATSSPALASIVGGFVQTLSKLAITLNGVAVTAGGVAGSYGATIVSSSFTIDGQTLTGPSATTAAIQTSGTLVLTATATDSRGRIGTYTQNVTVLPYAKPAIGTFTVKRATGGGTIDPNGTSLSINLIAAVSSLVVGTQKNDLKWAFKKQVRGGTTDWATITPDASGDALSTGISTTLIRSTYPIANSYDVRIEVTDNLGQMTPLQATVSTGGVLMHFSTSADGIGIGKYWTQGSVDAYAQMYQNNGQKVIDQSMAATTAAAGVVTLATDAEATTGTDAAKAVTAHALAAAQAASLNTQAPVKVSFAGSTLVTIPCSGYDEYEIEWEVQVSGGSVIMRQGTTGVPLTAAVYDSNDVYAGGTNATPTSGGDMNEATTSWHVSPASSASRDTFMGLLRFTHLNENARTRFLGTVTSAITAGGTTTSNNSTAVAAVAGNYRTASTQNELYLLTTTGGTMSGFYTIRKIKYQS